MRTLSRRCLLVGVAVAVLTVPSAIAQASDHTPLRLRLPAPTGPYRVGATELHLVDGDRPDPWVTGRPRELMVTVWYPARPSGREPVAPYLPPLAAEHFAATATAATGIGADRVDWTGISTHARTGARAVHSRRPVVLYSPGGGQLRAEGTILVEELTSRGYVVVTVDHTYEAPAVEFPGGRLEVQRLPDLEPAALGRAMIRTRVRDTRFVLDQLEVLARGGNPDAGGRPLPAGLGRALDLSRVGMFGHSAGGFTAAEAMLADRRLDAGADLDGSMAYSFSNNDFGDVVSRGLDRPFLLMGAGLSAGAPHTHVDAIDWRSFWANSTGWKLDLYVPAGEHFTFTDRQALLPQVDAAFDLPDGLLAATIGTVDPRRSIAAQRAYLVAFFDLHLRHRPQPLLDGPSPRHPDVVFVGGGAEPAG
jgi:predicted dienelactone hydrolase